ncbi:MAG: cytochrome C oxidase subunit IV family protein [Saprospiraceae bacterium]|nr:cytochrome C oxidase subunit IV family protein [Saprospiraceae bacterium]MCF8252091.1 cytochrome C oxidase subunit IV family protein [Saprospiraceae bacterium]MCF8283211.1 cytochrome C oxidase subunit IV family protein [Bacteroidales bacterium]MCF8313734.1 cytochrome C oxidase subunit IV family protein [Saprospiraceae bacterium]MCF8442458.1 cytochrome C oxidase subunit IV family protein [Saprospiraceae bacterium]
MKHYEKYNRWAWALLVLLTAVSGFVAFGQEGKTALVLILGISACAKVLVVVCQFMEMKKAHGAWLVLIGLILLAYLALLFVLR